MVPGQFHEYIVSMVWLLRGSGLVPQRGQKQGPPVQKPPGSEENEGKGPSQMAKLAGFVSLKGAETW